MAEPDIPSPPFGALRRTIRVAGSTWTGVILIGTIAVYLAAASLLAATRPDVLEALGTGADDVFSHWLLVALEAMLCVNVVTATITRIPLSLPRLGAWLCHAGVIVLAVGSAWYALARVRGDCATWRTPDGWTPINHFYVERTAAMYVWDEPKSQREQEKPPYQTPITELRIDRTGNQSLNTAISAPPDVDIRAKGFFARAWLSYQWRDTSPNEVPAVMLRIADGESAGTVVLSPVLRGFFHYPGRDYLLVHRPDATPELLDRMVQTTQPDKGLRERFAVAAILTGRNMPPTLVLARPDGSRWQAPLAAGETLDVPLAVLRLPLVWPLSPPCPGLEVLIPQRTITIEPIKFFTHATRVYQAAPSENDAPSAGPVLEVEVAKGNWRQTTYLPFAGYEELSYPQRMDLPGGQVLYLAFSRVRKALDAEVQVLIAEYQTYPASVVPKDFLCQLEISAKDERRSELLSLNNPVQVGPYQLSQGTWGPTPERVMEIRLIVASRPGLGVIWAGLVMISIGLPYAFYVKPLILRRRARCAGGQANTGA
jgi:hypothetical protein